MPPVAQTGGLISTVVLISVEFHLRVEIREIALRWAGFHAGVSLRTVALYHRG